MNRREIIQGSTALGALAAAPAAFAQPAAPVSLRRGINIGYLMGSPDHSPDNKSFNANPFEAPRHTMSDEDLARLHRLGFDFIRLIVSPGVFTADGGVRAPALYKRLDETLHRLLGFGFSVLVDLHPFGPVEPYTPAQIGTPAGAALWPDYLKLVGEIARRVAAVNPDRIAFEPLNEPRVNGRDWPALQQELYRTVRANARSLTFVVNAAAKWDWNDLPRLDPTPFVRDRTLFTFHYYEPFEFTHQAIPGKYGALGAVRWPAALEARTPGGTNPQLRDYLQSDAGPGLIAKQFAAIHDWAQQHGIDNSRIFIGEFGSQRKTATKNGPSEEDRGAWIAAVRTAAQRERFGWAYFQYENPDFFGMRNPDGSLDATAIRALGLNAT